MASPQSDAATPTDLPPVKLDPVAALLSYLIPGLGQVYQGRVGKGLLFFFGLYLLFFYGMWMGQWRNVWLPDTTDLPPVVMVNQQFEGTLKAITYRPQFLGQFWIGMAAWPAVYQYIQFDPQRDAGPLFGKFERAPSEQALNDLQQNGSKRWDLGWVYTVIAGVLNMLVIYDAFAGPMFRDPPKYLEKAGRETAKPGEPAPVLPKPQLPPVATPSPQHPGPGPNANQERGGA
jgi:hypothetical protein